MPNAQMPTAQMHKCTTNQEGVPESHDVRQFQLSGAECGEPPKGVELRVHLQLVEMAGKRRASSVENLVEVFQLARDAG